MIAFGWQENTATSYTSLTESWSQVWITTFRVRQKKAKWIRKEGNTRCLGRSQGVP